MRALSARLRRPARRTCQAPCLRPPPHSWVQVADEECAPSWDAPRHVALRVPLVVPPHQRRALFVHSNLPDDLGIQCALLSRPSPAQTRVASVGSPLHKPGC